VRLVALNLPDPSRGVFAHLGAADLACLATGPYETVGALLADARDAAIGQLLDAAGDPWDIRDGAAFDAALEAVRPEQAPVMAQIVRQAVVVLAKRGEVQAALSSLPATSAATHEVSAQMDDLVFDGFLHAIPSPWSARLPYWLDGMNRRLATALTDPARDERGRAELAPVLDAYARLVAAGVASSDEVDRLGYLIEELRLQVFAQPLRTIEPVSVKRLLAAIAKADLARGLLIYAVPSEKGQAG